MNRRHFFQKLASGILVAAAPNLFIPKLIAPRWKQRVVALDELPEHSLAKLTTQLILMRNLDYMREAIVKPEDYLRLATAKVQNSRMYLRLGSGINWNWGQNPLEDYVIVAPRKWA